MAPGRLALGARRALLAGLVLGAMALAGCGAQTATVPKTSAFVPKPPVATTVPAVPSESTVIQALQNEGDGCAAVDANYLVVNDPAAWPYIAATAVAGNPAPAEEFNGCTP
jgi:hypothetical protein